MGMSAGSIIGGGIRLVRTRPRLVATWAALYFAVMTIGMVVMQPFTTAMLAFQQQAAANTAKGIKTPPPFPADWFGLLFLVELVFLVLMVMAFAAVIRAVVRPSENRFAYLRLGMDELRLLGLGILFVIAGFVAEILAILAIVLVGLLIALVAGQAAVAIIAIILGIALCGGAVYVGIRLSLAGALTVMRGRIVIRDAWRITRGHFWTLFGVFALLAIVFTVVTIIVIALTNPDLLAAYASFDPQVMAAAGQEQVARQSDGLTAGMIVQLVVGAIIGAMMAAVSWGAMATAALEWSNAGVPARR
jgi:hypothetical protein